MIDLFRIFPLFLLCTLLLLPGCIDEIELDLPVQSETKLVIEGHLIKGKQDLQVTISAKRSNPSAEVDLGAPLEPYESAFLIINDTPFPEFQLENGVTHSFPLANFEQGFSIGPGTTFKLSITLTDQRVFESKVDVLTAVPEIASIDINPITRPELNSVGTIRDEDYVEILISTPTIAVNNERTFLKWDMEAIYQFQEAPPPASMPTASQQDCYLPLNLGSNNVVLFNGKKTNSDFLENFALIELPVDYKFANGYLITVFQQSLSSNAFEYWDQVRLNNSQSGGLFDPLPGTVGSNIYNINDPDDEVLGFFYVSQVDTIRRLIKPEEVGRPVKFCEGRDDIDYCQECTLLDNSTLTKPPYWMD